jgi:hypothetical protein
MSDPNQVEIYRSLRSGQDKYAYFLLAAAGAAIALTVNQTQGAKLALSQLPLAAAVLSWALSFIFGCMHLQYVNSTLYANAGLLKVQSGEHPEVGTHPQLMSIASDGIRDAIENSSNSSAMYARWQFRLLVGGGVLFIVWHVTEMYLRAVR